MTEPVTLFIQILFAVTGGSVSAVVLTKHNKLVKDAFLPLSWMLYVFYCFWGMCVMRCILLKGRELCVYRDNAYLLAADAVLVCALSVFFCVTKERDQKRDQVAKAAACAILAVTAVAGFIKFMIHYANVNAAVYALFMPQNAAAAGGGLLVCLLLVRMPSGERHIAGNEIVCALLILITFFLFPAFETFMANAGEFRFSVWQVWRYFLLSGVLVFIFLLAFMLLLSEKRRKILCFAGAAFSICAYLQEMFLNNRLFLMDGKKSEWGARLKISNLIIWGIVFLSVTLACFYKKNSSMKIITFVSIGLCLMQTAGAVSLIPSYRGKTASAGEIHRSYLSMEGIDEVAVNENVIVFVLDTYDVDFMEQVLAKKADFLEPLNGFIYFPDNVSQFSRTFPSIPYMLTEEMHFYETPLSEYVDNAFSKCRFWDNIVSSGYEVYLFEEDENIIGSTVRGSAYNFVAEGRITDEKISFAGCAGAMAKIGAYRLFPYAFKQYYAYTSGEINDMVIDRRILDVPMYEGDDALLCGQLRKNGLTIGSGDKAFRFIHTNGAHAPYTLSSSGERVHEENTSPVGQYMGCMCFVFDYLAELKRLGVYENSTIVITADHGENFTDRELPQEVNPILFVKPRGNTGNDDAVQVSDTSASQNDLLPTLAAQMGIGYDDTWGMNLLDTKGQDDERVRYHYYSVVENGLQTKAEVYKIEGNSRDFKNWTATGEYREFGKYY